MEPVAVALIRVVDAKGEIIPKLSLVRPNVKLKSGEVSVDWVPYIVLVPPALMHSLRSIFPKDYNRENVECRLIDLTFKNSVLALYGPEPKGVPAPVEDAPKPVPPVGAPVPLPATTLVTGGSPVALPPGK